MMHNRVARIVLFVIGCLIGGCSSQSQYDWKFDPATNFSGLHTYSWIEGEQKGTAMHTVGGESIPELITQTVDQEMATKGYVKAAEAKNPDFLITYTSILSYDQRDSISRESAPSWHESRQEQYDNPMPPDSAGAPAPAQLTAVGTVILRILDPKNHATIWQGTAESAIKTNVDPITRKQRFEAAIHKLLDNFPPKPKS